MASAQVLRKQEHLEAGKRRLEEFRKKKAADRAKKVSSSSQLHSADVDPSEKQTVETDRVRVTELDGAGTSDGSGRAVIESSVVVDNSNDKGIESLPNNYLDFSTTYNNPFSTETVDVHGKDHEHNQYDMSGSDGPVNVNFSHQTREKNDDLGIYSGPSGRGTYGNATDQSIALRPQAVRDNDSNSSQTSHYGLEEAESKDNHSYVNDFKVINSDTSRVPPENSGSNFKFGYGSPLASSLRSSSYEDSIRPTNNILETSLGVGQSVWGTLQPKSTMTFGTGERQLSSLGDPFPANSVAQWASESRSTGFSFDVRNSTDHVSPHLTVSETSTKRSRPSFLDSINVPRVSALENSPTETERVEPFSKLRTSSVFGSFEHSTPSSVSAGNGSDLYTHRVDDNTFQRKDDFYSRKQDEDFSALEQHIEDLTQEKFSLQRALEASRALAESLATENSSLTDSYNQQGSVVNQLKADMEKLQEEIKAELVELESLRIQYANAQLECNAADERSKLLASEVIGLEEKALRLRSSELKLERQLENSQAEITSFRKRVSSLEKERQDLQSTIDALQEEKKLLQAKLRKASAAGKSIDAGKSPANKKDVSTSTEDLVHRNADTTEGAALLEMHSGAPLVGSDASSFPLPPESRQLNLEVSSSNIPPDQIRMIQNINTLISELALEKEELMQALVAESSQSSQLKDLNKELSRRLEAQTQRLELLTAQSMANESVRARQPDSHTIPDNTPYADEGDEVVERVLGWIMKLFPGGPSRRRTSKLL